MRDKNKGYKPKYKALRKLLYKNWSIFTVLLISLLVLSCNGNDKIADEISKVSVNLRVLRFDQDVARAQPSDIPSLKQEYPYLFPAQYSDSVWAKKLQDTIQIELFSEVEKAFPDFKKEKEDLENLFKHIIYYFPRRKVPTVVTLTSEVDYQNRIILTDTLLLIGLDNYLGTKHRFYQGMQNYIAKRLDKKFLVSDVANAFANSVVPRPRERSFLFKIINFGKVLYLKDKIMPFGSDAEKIGYTQDEFDWALANEEPIWRNFIEQEHLYSTDNKLNQRFLDPAPFSKFGLELDNESPGEIGRYIGWQIVRAFMEKNDLSLQQLIDVSAEEIFNKSNYKPKE